MTHRRMDVLNADLTLQTDYEKWVKGKKKVARRKKEEDEAGYHFVAYVPINGSVWRLDGLQKRPVNLGKCTPGLIVMFSWSTRQIRQGLGLTG